ncbi:ankyrin repeat-containing domain protein [Amylocarpus encephaloides]|uniref:Ankyrin repeat-containing domain protein n=1 Tax=Amylocarpus encephaloides TaxID=45428 RepID=A0A9P8C710_9HELO|nr:ankyrin repeat-containing domain protein [Amylocarpus encephaloides]
MASHLRAPPTHDGSLQAKFPWTKTLFTEFVNINAKSTKTGGTALQYAAKWDRYTDAARLLELGADPNILSDDGYSVLWHASSWNGNADLIKASVKAGANVNAQAPDGTTVLHREVWCGNYDSVAFLLESGADPNITDHDQESSLHKAAAWRGYEKIVRFLLKSGAMVNSQKNDLQTPLHVAVVNDGCFDTCVLLLEHGACLSMQDSNGNSPLDIALKSGVSRQVLDLLLAPCPTSTPAFHGETDGKDNSPSSTIERYLSSSEKEVHSFRVSTEVSSEEKAFQTSVSIFESSLQATSDGSSNQAKPRRLINIYTGELEPGTPDMKYVIASYIWYPEALVSTNYSPRDPIRSYPGQAEIQSWGHHTRPT